MLTTAATYNIISANLPRTLSATAAKPQVARETDYYLAHIESVKSIEDLFGDERLFSYAMRAFGLQDMTYAKAFMRKVLTEGVDDREAFANKLADRRYREFAEAFDFARYGDTATIFDRTRQGTVDRYVRQTLEEDAGRQNEGVRLALYFERKVPSITSALSILGDPALLKVVQTAFDLPITMSLLDIDRQARMIGERLDVEDLKDTDKLASFLERFASLWDAENPTTSTFPVLFAQPLELGLGADLLASLQNLKLGGR